jgi:single-strand DNA-binding protein
MADNAKVALTGRLTREPTQNTYNNSTVVSFSIAVNTTKKEGENYIPDYYNVSIWGKPAEFILPRIQKGTLVQVYGSLQQGEYNDKKTGEKRLSLNVRATEILPLTGAKSSDQKKNNNEGDPF